MWEQNNVSKVPGKQEMVATEQEKVATEQESGQW
jgi:hypothetical protein